jgi:predicted CoA-binding protein
MSQDDVKKILMTYRTVAVVGLSRDPSKESYSVAEYLKRHGFHVIPVNPVADEILGEKCYKSLMDMPADVQKTIEVVDIFRPSADVPPIVEEAVKLRRMYGVPFVVWMQLGIVNEQAAETARKVGLTVIMNKCMMREHKRLFGEG